MRSGGFTSSMLLSQVTRGWLTAGSQQGGAGGAGARGGERYPTQRALFARNRSNIKEACSCPSPVGSLIRLKLNEQLRVEK